MRRKNSAKATAVAYLVLSVLAAESAAVQAAGPTVVELGTREAGKTYPLQLEARNENCPQPLDFRFISGTPWIKLPPDPFVRQVPQGQSKPLNAVLDFTRVAPGDSIGTVDVECANCGWLIFKTCKIDKQTLQMRVRVITPGPGQGTSPLPQPNAPAPNTPGMGGTSLIPLPNVPMPDTSGGGSAGPPPVVPKPENPAQPLNPARPGEGDPTILPYRPQIPDDVRIRIENAERALEEAKRAELPCKSWMTFATLRRSAANARAQAEKAKKAAEDAERTARGTDDAVAEAERDLSAAAAERDKRAAEAQEAKGFAAWLQGGTNKAANDAYAQKQKKADAAVAVANQKANAVKQAKEKAAKARQEADRARDDAKKAEEKAKAAEAALKAKEDECAKLKQAREEAERDLAEAKAAARTAR